MTAPGPRLAAPRAAPTLIDRLDLGLLRQTFPPGVLDAGEEAVHRGAVSRPGLGETRAVALVVDQRRQVRRAVLALRDGALATSCTCGAPRCVHAAALGLLLVLEPPPHGSAGDPSSSPRDDELARRRARGASDLFALRRLPGQGAGLLGAYAVASPSSHAYRVVIRALDAPHNGCTCPDFAQNLLGTCKHVEAVLHRLRTDAPRRWRRALAAGPARSYLHLRFAPAPAVGLRLGPGPGPRVRRLAARSFDAEGRLRGALADAWPALEAAAAAGELELPAEVAALAERQAGERHAEARRLAVEAEVREAGPVQPGLVRRLYPFQVEGAAFLASRGRALLADDMGLGKTAQAIAALTALARRGEVRRTVVVCPASLKHQWLAELRAFTGGAEGVVVVGGAREARLAAYARAPRLLVTSYELLRADAGELAALAPDLLVLDEAQRVRNWRTRTAAAVKSIPSRFAFVLTGTPLENRLDDLYSLMQVVDPHLLGPLWSFNAEFTRMEDGRPTGYQHLDGLRARLAPVVLRRRKEEVLPELPARIVSRRGVPMTRPQWDIHDEAEQRVARLLAILKKRPLSPLEEQRLLRAFQRMRMACDAAGLVDGRTAGAPKVDELSRLLEELCLGEGRKVVVFSEWERMQSLAAEACGRLGVGYVRLHGGVPSASRGPLIERFREDPRCKVFLSTDAGGTGLNLQVASHVINLDLPWNPAVLAQRIARVHRLGQERAVSVVLLVSEESFEARLEWTLEGKRALFAAAVGDDAETVELERTSMAGRIATLLSGEFAASTGQRPPERSAAVRDEPPAPAAPVVDLQRHLAALVDRKARAADALLAAGRLTEALPLVREATALLFRAIGHGHGRSTRAGLASG